MAGRTVIFIGFLLSVYSGWGRGTDEGLLFQSLKEKQKGLRYNDYCFVLCLVGVCVCEGCPVRAPGPVGLCALRARTLPCAGSGWVFLIFALTLTLRARDAAWIPQQTPLTLHPERRA